MTKGGDQGAPGTKPKAPAPGPGTRASAAKVLAQPAAASSSAAAAAASIGGPGDQENKSADEIDADEAEQADTGAAQASGGSGVDVAAMLREMQTMRDEMKRMQQAQLQQPLPQALSLGASPPPPSANDFAAVVRAMQENSAQQAEQARKQQEAAAEQARKQQAASAAQLLVLQSLGDLPTFNGKGADTTLTAQEWLQRAEDFFTAREQALGTDAALGDRSRLLSAATALQDDARRWYTALPQRPATWAEFCEAVRARFCSVPSERIRVDRLTEFVDKAARVRDKLNVQGMQAFTSRFAQLAGEVPDDLVTGRGSSRCWPEDYPSATLR